MLLVPCLTKDLQEQRSIHIILLPVRDEVDMLNIDESLVCISLMKR